MAARMYASGKALKGSWLPAQNANPPPPAPPPPSPPPSPGPPTPTPGPPVTPPPVAGRVWLLCTLPQIMLGACVSSEKNRREEVVLRRKLHRDWGFTSLPLGRVIQRQHCFLMQGTLAALSFLRSVKQSLRPVPCCRQRLHDAHPGGVLQSAEESAQAVHGDFAGVLGHRRHNNHCGAHPGQQTLLDWKPRDFHLHVSQGRCFHAMVDAAQTCSSTWTQTHRSLAKQRRLRHC